MPKGKREKSNTDVYHCIVRGINKQDIFFDDQDYLKFLKVLSKAKELFQFKLYSYVLMPNHIHLQIKDEKQNLSEFMHSIEISYAFYFNKKYQRIGHVYENKFRSKPVETDEYMKNLQRYIHQNPQNAFIDMTEKYKWSSYKEYIYEEKIVDTEDILNLFSNNKEEAKKEFIKFNKQIIKVKDGNELLEYEIKKSLTDQELIDSIKNSLNIDNIQEIQYYSRDKRDKLLGELIKLKGCTHKQLSRVLGINIRIIERGLDKAKKNG